MYFPKKCTYIVYIFGAVSNQKQLSSQWPLMLYISHAFYQTASVVSVLASIVITRGFEPRSVQTRLLNWYLLLLHKSHSIKEKEQRFVMCNVSVWGDMCIRGLLFQWASNIKIQQSVLVLYKADLIIISLKINLFSPWHSCKIVELALNNNHSLTTDPFFYDIFVRLQWKSNCTCCF